jgi:hypothetical protein
LEAPVSFMPRLHEDGFDFEHMLLVADLAYLKAVLEQLTADGSVRTARHESFTALAYGARDAFVSELGQTIGRHSFPRRHGQWQMLLTAQSKPAIGAYRTGAMHLRRKPGGLVVSTKTALSSALSPFRPFALSPFPVSVSGLAKLLDLK